jgi:hypothetical protein
MSAGAPPLVAGRVYGLRTWRVRGERGSERLAAPHRDLFWPTGGEPLVACCEERGHAAPAADCQCGIHAYHPRPASAKRVLAGRFELPGIVEAWGHIEVHEDGFRAERGRPHALVLTPGRYAAQVRRLAAAYDVPVIEVSGRAALLAYCEQHGLGLSPQVVDGLLGDGQVERRHATRRRRKRLDALRVGVALLLAALLCLAGLRLLVDPPGPRVLWGRTGEIHVK